MTRFEEINVGDVAQLKHTISKYDIERFVDLTGDDNRLHIDEVYAANTSFKKPVAHGMLGASFISTIIGTKLPGDGALWFSQNLEFILPVRIGDLLEIRAEVLKKIDNLNAIVIQTDIYNQHGQIVTTGVAKVKIIEQQEILHESKLSVRKVALVIGGSGGIGSAICRTLAKDGFDVAVHYFSSKDSAQKVSDEIKSSGGHSVAIRANIENESEVKIMVEQVIRKFGGITVLVNCATAKIVANNFSKLCWDDFDRHIRMTILGAFFLTRQVIPVMKEKGFGKIIQIGSQAVDSPSTGWLPYITAKSALVGFSHALALELAPMGILVNIVSPGMTDTEQIADVPERIRLMTAAKTPLRRLAKPEDVAGVVAFLASDRADFLTGETVRVNGGQVML